MVFNQVPNYADVLGLEPHLPVDFPAALHDDAISGIADANAMLDGSYWPDRAWTADRYTTERARDSYYIGVNYSRSLAAAGQDKLAYEAALDYWRKRLKEFEDQRTKAANEELAKVTAARKVKNSCPCPSGVWRGVANYWTAGVLINGGRWSGIVACDGNPEVTTVVKGHMAGAGVFVGYTSGTTNIILEGKTPEDLIGKSSVLLNLSAGALLAGGSVDWGIGSGGVRPLVFNGSAAFTGFAFNTASNGGISGSVGSVPYVDATKVLGIKTGYGFDIIPLVVDRVFTR